MSANSRLLQPGCDSSSPLVVLGQKATPRSTWHLAAGKLVNAESGLDLPLRVEAVGFFAASDVAAAAAAGRPAGELSRQVCPALLSQRREVFFQIFFSDARNCRSLGALLCHSRGKHSCQMAASTPFAACALHHPHPT